LGSLNTCPGRGAAHRKSDVSDLRHDLVSHIA
jgi:hypothetical protein